jgi:SAM-dependent methyltransferase
MPVIDRELFAEFVAVYAFQPATAYWRAIEVPALIGLGIERGRGIDIGCGDGKLTAIVARGAGLHDLVGVDPDPEETAAARRLSLYRAVHSASAGDIPEPDGAFDYAISNSVLEHIPELEPVLAEVARVLRRGGGFYLTVPHAGFHAQLAGPLMPGVSRAEYETRLDRRLAHLRYPSEAEWRAMLDRHGFGIEAVRFYLGRGEVRRWETLSRWTAGVLDTLSAGRVHPIMVQRRLGLRQAQNAFSWPRPCARLLSRVLALGVPGDADLTAENTGCVAIRCRKR